MNHILSVPTALLYPGPPLQLDDDEYTFRNEYPRPGQERQTNKGQIGYLSVGKGKERELRTSVLSSVWGACRQGWEEAPV